MPEGALFDTPPLDFMKEIVGKSFLDDKLKDKSSGLIGERIDVRLSQARPYGLFV